VVIAGAIAALHALGLGLLVVLVLPAHLELGDGAVFGLGLGLTAYALGARHAFDADHIAAIDTVTRRLIGTGDERAAPPVGVGFFFALGHSTVVFALAVLLALGVRGLGAAVADDGSALQAVTGTVGPAISGGFLIVLGAANALVLLSRRRGGRAHGGGLLTRLLARPLRGVRSPGQMYPVGLLFGLGFDTATEIALLGAAGAAAAGGLPVYAILCLPLLFAAGMTLFDTLNGVLVGRAYGWARERERRGAYDAALTGLTAAIALTIGAIELASVAGEQLHLAGPFALAGSVDLTAAGPAVAAALAATWGGALLLNRRAARRVGA
jgi:high-affinity nickel-transport protein